MLISKTLLLMASSLALATPTLAQEQSTAFEYSPVVRLMRSGQFQAEVWRRDVRTNHSDLAWSNRETYPTAAAAMIEACTSLRKNFDVPFSCSDQQPVVLARDDSAARNEVHDGMSLGRHGPQQVPQGILDAQRRWIELEAVPRGVQGREAPARATPQRSAAPITSKAAASRGAPQGRARNRAPANSSATDAAVKSAVPAGKRKVVVYEEVILVPSGAWLKDFWKNQDGQSGGGGSEGGGSGGGGGGHGY
jgi:uncharacterized membrane protein YgcG